MVRPLHSLRSFALVPLLLSFVIVGQARAQELSFVPTPVGGVFVCPNPIVVDLTIDPAVADLRGFSITLSYDPAVLNPLSVTAGPLVASASCGNTVYWIDPATNDGSLEVDLALLGCSVDGPGSVLTIRIRGRRGRDDHPPVF